MRKAAEFRFRSAIGSKRNPMRPGRTCIGPCARFPHRKVAERAGTGAKVRLGTGYGYYSAKTRALLHLQPDAQRPRLTGGCDGAVQPI